MSAQDELAVLEQAHESDGSRTVIPADDLPDDPIPYSPYLKTRGPAEIAVPKQGELLTLGPTSLWAEEFAYILEGKDDFFQEFADRRLRVESSYKAFREEFEPYIAARSALSSTGLIGIDGGRAEAMARLAVGHGNYRTSDLKLVACGPNPAVATYQDAAYLIIPADLGTANFDVDMTEPLMYTPEHGLPLCEEFEWIGDGVDVLATALTDFFDITLTDYHRLVAGAHEFHTAAGDIVRLREQDIRYACRAYQDPTKLVGDFSFTAGAANHEHTTHIAREDFEYTYGDPYLTSVYDDAYVLGVRRAYVDPTQSTRTDVYPSVYAITYYLQERTTPDSQEYRQFDVRSTRSRITAFKDSPATRRASIF